MWKRGLSMKKRFSVFLTIILVLTLLAACSNAKNKGDSTNTSNEQAKGTTTADTTLQEKTFTFLDYSNPSWPYNKDWPVWKFIKEKTGVTLDVQVPSGEMNDALNLTVASGNMPDLMFTFDKNLADKFGQQGALANILDYVDIMPNFKQWMDKYPQDTQNVLSADGKMYMFPNQGIGLTNRMHYLYRKDIFEKNNLKEPATWDELYTVLKKLKQIYPNSYPFAFRDGLQKMINISPAFETDDDVYYDFDKKEWRYGPVEDNYKKIVQYLKTFVKEGLMPPDFLSIDTKQWQDLMSTERTFVTIDYIGRIDFFNKPLRAEKPDFNLVFMPPPAGSTGGKQLNAFTQVASEGMMVSSTSKKIKDVMKYMDFFYSEQGRDLASWGKEGETYKVEGGKKVLGSDYADVSDYRKKTGVSTDGTYTWFDYDAHISLASKELKDAYEQAPKYDTVQQPQPAFTDQEMEILSTTGQEITKFRDENIAKFILGTKSMDDWGPYVAELKNLGLDKILQTYKTAYDRALSATK
jgi:putative aldouronate transport system substrate-binding protein